MPVQLQCLRSGAWHGSLGTRLPSPPNNCVVLPTQSLTSPPHPLPYLCVTLQVFDAFSPRLTDRNSKVNLHALEAFSNIVPLLGNTLVPIVNNVVTALVPNLASRNPTIHSTAMTVLDLLSQCIGKRDTTEVFGT